MINTKNTFCPGLVEKKPFVTLCRNTYWICPLESFRMYFHKRQMMGSFDCSSMTSSYVSEIKFITLVMPLSSVDKVLATVRYKGDSF